MYFEKASKVILRHTMPATDPGPDHQSFDLRKTQGFGNLSSFPKRHFNLGPLITGLLTPNPGLSYSNTV